MEDKYQDRIADYLNGNLTMKEAGELLESLREEGYDLSALDEMEKLIRQMDDITVPEPREEMHDRFYEMLEAEKSGLDSKRSFSETLPQPFRFLFSPGFMPRVAYAGLLLSFGIMLGNWVLPSRQLPAQTAEMMDEIQGMKTLMALTLLEQSGASDRLRAVSYTRELSQPGEQVCRALLETLNNDPSVNVRLASLEALTRHISNPEVRIGLVQSISRQDAPLVQMAIADLMLKIEEKNAVPEMEKLLERNNLNETVAEKLTESISLLT